MQRPPEIEKGAAANDAPDGPLPQKTAYPTVYRQDCKDASNGPLKLLHGKSLAERLLNKACADVVAHPSQLPLWAFRLYQHQRRGALGYQQVWDALYEVGRERISDKWAHDCLLHAIAQANASTVRPPSMQTLLRGLQ